MYFYYSSTARIIDDNEEVEVEDIDEKPKETSKDGWFAGDSAGRSSVHVSSEDVSTDQDAF
jgi:hypothetical protein